MAESDKKEKLKLFSDLNYETEQPYVDLDAHYSKGEPKPDSKSSVPETPSFVRKPYIDFVQLGDLVVGNDYDGSISHVDGDKGRITVSDINKEIFFYTNDTSNLDLVIGEKVSFSAIEGKTRGYRARNIRKLGQRFVSEDSIMSFGNPRFIEDELAKLAFLIHDEDWSFRETVNSHSDPYGILKNYIKYTFQKLQSEDKIAISEDEQYACFNTGLLDRMYDRPIYAIWGKNTRLTKGFEFQKWYLIGYTYPGSGAFGGVLDKSFRPTSIKPATYFTQLSDLLFDADLEITVNYEHIVERGLRKDRFPESFIKRFFPEYSSSEARSSKTYIDTISGEILNNRKAYEGIVRTITAELETSRKKASQDYRFAVPIYNPERGNNAFMLPITLSKEYDAAVVFSEMSDDVGRKYMIHTIVTDEMAYCNARLVCKPNPLWLKNPEIRVWE